MNQANVTVTRFRAPRLILGVLGALLACVLLAASTAVAQDPISAQYGSTATEVASNPPAQEASGLEETVISGLPFTGLDVIALVAVALALVSIGFALRRLSAQPQQD